MSRLEVITSLIKEQDPNAVVSVKDKSESHRGHGGFIEGQVTHIHLQVVSVLFEGKTRICRHRFMNDLLENELENGLHAVNLKLLTPNELNTAHNKI
ncbi:MAG: BolA family transcriptional regulator [Micavibrio sp.]|nr:BolA family transcriptional regulator [Micavibrio sp.]|tara:strand:+ start:9914 stop:10204 length:291 start_codon:yes stop_codon:yes gene_type:complete